ncbi:hypothetical protein [Limibacterium fermenti]|uniref:hypothetical protein n=1 Tax=Limibacterium fermenti TaxID=3229863 RepID=UPI00267EE068
MKIVDRNFLNMIGVARRTLHNHQSEWEKNVRMTQEVTNLDTTAERADTLSTEVTTDITGSTTDKINARQKVIAEIVKLVKPASVIGLDTNDMLLHRQLSVSKGMMNKMKYGDLADLLDNLYALLVKHQEKLVDYDITLENVTAAKTFIDAYKATLSEPRELVVERKTTKEALSECLADLRGIVYVLDNLMKRYDGTPFYSEYKNARIIVDLGTHKKKEDKK